jgi:hypothetical protein
VMQQEVFISRELLHENPSSLRLIISFLFLQPNCSLHY